VVAEREIAERVVARFDWIWADHVRLEAIRWEHGYYQAIAGFQEAIESTAAFDLVLGILWKRNGTPLPLDKFCRSDGHAYESGTVFELESALESATKSGRPAVYVFRKTCQFPH
jgi:hypothetical protein